MNGKEKKSGDIACITLQSNIKFPWKEKPTESELKGLIPREIILL